MLARLMFVVAKIAGNENAREESFLTWPDERREQHKARADKGQMVLDLGAFG